MVGDEILVANISLAGYSGLSFKVLYAEPADSVLQIDLDTYVEVREEPPMR